MKFQALFTVRDEADILEQWQPNRIWVATAPIMSTILALKKDVGLSAFIRIPSCGLRREDGDSGWVDLVSVFLVYWYGQFTFTGM